MTKNELAEQVARQNGVPASQARQMLETTIEVISGELAAAVAPPVTSITASTSAHAASADASRATPIPLPTTSPSGCSTTGSSRAS